MIASLVMMTLDAGSINPYELFLIFNELTSACSKKQAL